MKKYQHIIIGAVVVVLAIILFVAAQDANTPSDEQADASAVGSKAAGTSMPDGKGPVVEFSIQGALEDVSDGSAMGIAMAGYTDGLYVLDAMFEDLPDPTGTDFYEGWIVRPGTPPSVLSTGKAVKESAGVYSNVFTAEEDLLDHARYVLTLEPDDGDPAPAAHILEGIMEKK